MPTLWLVVPVHGREGLTRLCLEQKVDLIAELGAGHGIEASVLVVGNDRNLETARELGFQTLERPNVPLGGKINDGIEWACREGGADYVSFVGSDDWVLPEWAADLPEPDRVRSGGHQAFVSPRGDRLIVRVTKASVGGAPWVIPTTLLAECAYRPVWRDHKQSGMDFLIARTLAPKPLEPRPRDRYYERERRRKQKQRELWRWDTGPADLLRMVDFKGSREQITAWHSVVPVDQNTFLLDTADVWGTLATRYPADLVARMEKFYGEGLPRA